MATVILNGGLGNQLFQYSFGRKIAHKTNSELKLDITSYQSNKDRDYKLDVFNINAVEKEKYSVIFESKIINKIRITLDKLRPLKKKRYYREKSFTYDKNIEELKSSDIYLDGYWQSYKYFQDIEEIIREELTLKNNISEKYKSILEQINNTNSVSMHFRRTDYIDSKHSSIYYSLQDEYYQNAIQYINQKIENPTFFIFSDDIEWVKNNTNLPSSSIFVSQKEVKDYEEMILMSKCKHNIIANSSFSWWGAWLNNTPNKIVVAPKKWFKDEKKLTKDLIPNSWIQT